MVRSRLSTRLYTYILCGISAAFVLCVVIVAGLKFFSSWQPSRPHNLPGNAAWRPTSPEQVRLWPHGDWVSCRKEGVQDHCLLASVSGELEYEGSFLSLPGGKALDDARLQPIASESILPWMWSRHAGRLVPILQMEDGTILAPVESADDLRSYVERVQKFSSEAAPLPVYLEESRKDPTHSQPSATPEGSSVQP